MPRNGTVGSYSNCIFSLAKLILFRNYCNMEKESLVWKWGQFPGFLDSSVVKNLLPIKEAWVPSLVQEYPMCCKATKPMHHNY